MTVYLQSFAVHPNVPVGEVRDILDQARYYSVQTVGGHFSLNEREKRLRSGQDPPVHDVL